MNKVYPILYSRTNTGAIQTWQLEVEGGRYRCHFGQKDGKIQIGAWTNVIQKNIGKANETSLDEQAVKEADAEFLKKKSQKDYFENIDDVDKETFFSPQLAKQWLDYKNEIDLSAGKWCISPKLDGLRAIVTKNGSFSRNGKPFIAFPHIQNLLKPIFDKYPDFKADGEIYQHSFSQNFNKIISLAKKSKPTPEDIKESEELLEYWIFDCGSMDADFGARLGFIKWVVEEINDPRIKLVQHDVIKTGKEVEEKLANFLESGFEGAMLKDLTANYQNKRTKSVLKYKLFQDQEFVVKDILPGIGNRAGKFGKALLTTKAGREFEANARGDEETYVELLKNKHKYINKTATVRYQNITPDGSPRFPVIISFGRETYE